MWNRMFRQTYGLACLSIFVAIALAACETPAPGIAAPTVSKEIGDISSLAKDTSETVSLSDAFKGEKLTFSPPRSSNLNVAIPTITANNRSIVIRAIGPGTATITVTATNSGGNVSQSFEVTVPQPTTPPQTPPQTPTTPPQTPQTPTDDYSKDCPSTLPSNLRVTLKITRGGPSGKCTLPANHSLIYEDTPARVSVHRPGKENVWTITALMKGRPVVNIRNDQTGDTPGEITVIVPNAPPQLNTDAKGPVFTGDAGDAGEVETLMPDQGTGFSYITNSLNPGAFFNDTDTEDIGPGADDDLSTLADNQGLFRFKIIEKPDEVVIDTDRGFVAVRASTVIDTDVTTPFNSKLTDLEVDMRAVILKRPPGSTFDILLNAYDKDNDVSDNPVRLRFTAQDPQAGLYSVTQDDKGNFVYSAGKKALRIGNRLDVYHTVTVAGTGFTVAKLAAADLSKSGAGKRKLNVTLVHTAAAEICLNNEKPKDWDKYTDLGSHCYIVSGTNGVQFAAYDDDNPPLSSFDNTPEIKFKLDSGKRRLTDTSAPKITITYYVYALRSENDFTENDTEELAKLTRTTYSYLKALSLSVHRCVATTDCP